MAEIQTDTGAIQTNITNPATGEVLGIVGGEIVNTNIGVDVGFSGARVTDVGTQSISHNTQTAIEFDTERFDTEGYHDNSTNNTRLTIPAAGHYQVGGSLILAGEVSSTPSSRQLQIQLNGTTQISNIKMVVDVYVASDTTGLETSTVYEFAEGDYVELLVYQNTSETLATVKAGDKSPEFWIIRLGTTGGQSNLLGEVVLTSDAAFIEIENIPGTYKDLKIVAKLRGSNATVDVNYEMQVGGASIDTGSNYRWALDFDGSTEGTAFSESDTNILLGSIPGSSADAGNFGVLKTTIFGYSDSVNDKHFRSDGFYYAATTFHNEGTWGRWDNTADNVEKVRITATTGNIVAGSWIRVYGEPVLGGGSGLVKGDYKAGDLYLGGELFENQSATGRNPLYAVGGKESVPEWMRYLNGRQPDETPHADDDFFDDASKDSVWIEASVSGTPVWTESRDRLSVKADIGFTGDAAVFVKPITATGPPYTIETAARMFDYNTDFHNAGICFTDGTAAGSNAVTMWLASRASGVDTFQSHTGTLTDINNTWALMFCQNK